MYIKYLWYGNVSFVLFLLPATLGVVSENCFAANFPSEKTAFKIITGVGG